MKICTNCKSEYKSDELEECPKCKTKTLKYKDNKYAIKAFIASLFMPLGLIIFAIFNPAPSSFIAAILYIYLFISLFAVPVSIILAIAALISKKIYVNKYPLLAVLAIIITVSTFVIIILNVRGIDSDLCGSNGTWDCTLNTTIPINWNDHDQP